MDIVSFETAKKLKAAGFPEPEFACWQVWYNAIGIGTFLGRKVLIGEKMHFSCYSLGSGRVMDMIVGHGDGTTGSRWDLFDPPMPEMGIADGSPRPADLYKPEF